MLKQFRILILLAIAFAILLIFASSQGLLPSASDANRFIGTDGNNPGGRPSSSSTSVPIAGGTAEGGCSQNFFQGAQPALPEKMGQKLTLVCYQGYASANSAITRTPLWSAEHLTAGRIDTARATERVSKFFAEPSLDPDARGELDDYRRSGFDRGHLSPSGDMPGREQQQQSFSLANIAPQNGELNRGPWAELESRVRDLAQNSGEVWVVTGVLFEGAQVNTTPDGRVMVPTAFWKAVMVPGKGAVVFIANNSVGGVIDHVPLQAFRQRSGITPFPQFSSNSPELEID
jgi:endonuclease G